MERNLSRWSILCYMFGLNKFIFRVKLLRWLFTFLKTALRRCDKTADWGERLVYYKKAVVATFKLYHLLSEEEKKSTKR